MARTANVSVVNNFTQGLITEATTLNFPPNACTSANNVVFSRIGDVTRRLGFDFEQGYSLHTGQNGQGQVIVTYLWKSPAGIGNQNIIVVQNGNVLSFYIQVAGTTLSSGLSVSTINLDSMSVFNWGSPAGPGYNPSAGVSTIWSTSSNTIVGSGTVTWTVQAGLPVQVGQTVVAMAGGGNTNTMTGTVSSYNSTTGSLALTISSSTGSGTSVPYWTFTATALPGATQGIECQFASGNGYLFVAHEYCNPFYVTWDTVSTFTATSIPIRVRDFKGVADTVSSATQRPTSLTAAHRYNLANQGWPSSYTAASSTTLTSGTGSKTITITGNTPLPIQIGDRIRVYNSQATMSGGYNTNTGNTMEGSVTAYSFVIGTGWQLTFTSDTSNGAGTTPWTLVQEPNYLDAWNWAFNVAGAQTASYPSNSDTWSYFKNTSDIFDPYNQIKQVTQPNTQASQGHFILDPFFEQRNTISGVTGLPMFSTGQERPTTIAFYEGRVFYAGVNSQGFNARIYFSQIVVPNNTAGTANYAYCYQQEDPTDPNFFDLLPSDGGVIDILDAGTIYKMVPVLNSLVVFASNGVWAITGSSGTGFRANDYAIHKISAVYQVSGTSFVDVDGLPYWWNFEGIYRIALNPTSNAMRVEPLSLTTIKSFMDTVPEESLTYARGSFDPEAKIVQWCFKSTNSNSTYDRYSFDSILNFNTLSGAFYVWTINTSVNLNGIVAIPANIGGFVINQVIDLAGDTLISQSGANVITLSTSSSGAVGFSFFYLCSYGVETSLSITFAQNVSTNYLDWFSLDSRGQNYTSQFITGWMIKGATQSRWQTNYVRMWTNPSSTSTFQIQSFWNYNVSTGSAIRPQTVIIPPNNKPRRFKLRGNGLICQFQVTSVDAKPFDIQGWSVFETTSQWV
ncbi:MAG TPA: hypothetical protein VEP90_26130 [Methylomirabilota bacterium]|nr:hypothetical protein [Methylomirabilota bacterium]